VVEAASGEVSLSFETAGRITAVLVDEGDAVSAGQVLARLDGKLAQAQVARAEAALLLAQARRDAVLEGARDEEVRAATAEVAAAQAQDQDRHDAHLRAERLLLANAISRAEVDAARHAAETAGAGLQAARARLALLVRGARPAARREAQAAVAAAEAELREAQALLAQTELLAPRAGVVLRRLAEPGEQVTMTPQRTVLTLADMGQLQLRAEVDEIDVGLVTLGQRGYASAEAFGAQQFSGHVVRVARQLGRKNLQSDDPRARVDTRVLEVRFALDQGAAVPLGMRLDLHLFR
jgi:multidrug resistance efflux pump